MTNKNIGATFGITDRELIEEFNLNPSLEGKDGINDAMKDVVRGQIKQGLMADGMSEGMADKEAARIQRDNMS